MRLTIVIVLLMVILLQMKILYHQIQLLIDEEALLTDKGQKYEYDIRYHPYSVTAEKLYSNRRYFRDVIRAYYNQHHPDKRSFRPLYVKVKNREK